MCTGRRAPSPKEGALLLFAVIMLLSTPPQCGSHATYLLCPLWITCPQASHGFKGATFVVSASRCCVSGSDVLCYKENAFLIADKHLCSCWVSVICLKAEQILCAFTIPAGKAHPLKGGMKGILA